MALLDDQRRRQRKGIAAHAQVKPAIEAVDHDVIAARADAVATRRDFDCAHQADIADVYDVGQAFQRMQRIAPVFGHRRAARQKPLVLVDVERRSEEHTSELQSLRHLVCRLLLEKKKREKMLLRLSESWRECEFLFSLAYHLMYDANA